MQFGLVGQQPRKAGLAGAWRSPENDRGQSSGGNHAANRAIAADEMILADDLGELARTQAVRQRRVGSDIRFSLLITAVVKQTRHG